MQIDLDNKIVRFLVQEYVNKICNFYNENDLNYNTHKLIHTFQVVEMAQKLINLSKPTLSSEINTHILNSAVLHDIGRCYEFKKGKKVNIDHGKIGAKLIEKKFPSMVIEKQATLFHNKLPSEKDPESSLSVLNYVRDADMLANIQCQIDNTDIWLNHIIGKNKKSILSPAIDPEIFHAVQEKRPAKIIKIKTKNLLTLWSWQLCWYYNLRTEAALKFIQKEKLFIRFKKTIFKKIIPLTTKDKSLQKELIKKIQTSFPDKMFQ